MSNLNRLRLKVVITFTFTSMFFKLIIKSPTHKSKMGHGL